MYRNLGAGVLREYAGTKQLRRPCNIFGIVGRDIGYSLSPVIFNTLFRAEGRNDCYKLFDLKEESLDAFMQAVAALEVDGFNVTVPFKGEIIPYLKRLDKIAAETGSVNLVIRRRKDLVGYNTDYFGIADTIERKLKVDVVGKRVALVGSGGSARTVYYYLVRKRAAQIFVYHRSSASKQRFSAFVESLPRVENYSACTYKSKIGDLPECDLIVNATPESVAKLCPSLRPSSLMKVFELRYSGRTKPSPHIVDGIYMLAVQAVHNYRIMTGASASVSRIMDIIRKARRR
jgi:shikimate dehydrogenase